MDAEKIKILELFAGAGGLALGFEKAGLKTIGLVESNKDCILTLKRNRPNWPTYHSKVEDMEYSNFKGVDIISGGFPCQAFSVAGKRLGFKDKRGTLFFEMMRPIRELKPKFVLAENVQGLLWHDKGITLQFIINALKKEGYSCHYQLVNAIDFGVPQKRKRLIIIGALGKIDIDPINTKVKKIKTLKDALKGCPKSETAVYSEYKKKILSLVPPGGSWVNLPKDIQKEYMGKSYGSSSKLGGRRGMARRLSWEEPSLTILCSPSQKQTERCHPSEIRPFSIRESARIQTFPDNWYFEGSLHSKYRQIGNAIPVLLAKKIAKHLINLYYKNYAIT